jgi:O-antigen ligase/tetratricopeptide (TPR) repeat protein
MTKFSTTCDIAILILVVLVLLFTPFAFGGVNQTKALLEKTFLSPVLFYSNYFARLAIALAVMLWLMKMISVKEIRFVKTPLDIPIGLFVAYAFLWFVFSRAKYLTGGELANVVAYVALYYVVVNNVRTKVQMNILVGSLIISGFLIATLGLIQCSGYVLPSSGMKLDHAINLVRPEQYWGRVGGTFVCPNHFAGFMEMAIPFALAYVLFSKIPLGRKVLVAFGGLVMTMGLLLSISRGGWAGFAVSIAFVFAMAARAKKVPVAARVIPLVVILVGVAVVFTRSAYVQKRFLESFSEEDSSYLKRAHVLIDTMSLVRDHLLVGTGPGTFELAYREYRRPSVLLAIRYTHNDYLHTLSDYGLIGLAIVLSGIAAFATKMWATSKKLKRSLDKALAYGLLGAVIAILVHSLVDFNMHIPSNAMAMAVIVGVGMCLRLYRLHDYDESVVLSGQKPRLFPPAIQYGLIAVVLIATVGVLYMNFRAYASALVMHHAAEKDPSREFPGQNPDEKDFNEAERLYRKSASLFPSNAKPWASIANMYLWRADEALAKGEKNKFHFLLLGGREAKKDYEEAAAATKQALKRNHLDSSDHLVLARAYAAIVIINLEYKEGSPTQYSPSVEKEFVGPAIEAFQKALEMDPNNAAYHEHLGFFYYHTARYDQAKREVEQALEILPDTPMYSVQRKHLQQLLDKIHQKQQETTEAKSAFLPMRTEHYGEEQPCRYSSLIA